MRRSAPLGMTVGCLSVESVANEKTGRRLTSGSLNGGPLRSLKFRGYLALAVWLRTATHLPSRLAKTSIQAYLPLESLPS